MLPHAILILILASLLSSQINKLYEAEQVASRAAVIANHIAAITRAFERKIITEESIDGSNFGNLAVANGATWTIAPDQLIQQLMSNGTSGDPNDPACTNSSGSVIGLSSIGYLDCDFQDYLPYSGEKLYQATFTRSAPANPAPNYAVGYSQIKGTITFGSEPGEPFALDGENPDPELAFLIFGKLNQMYTANLSNQLLASNVSYMLTRDGTLQANIDLTRNAEIAIRSDGATAWNNDQSLGNNSLTEVKSLVWSNIASSELMQNGSIALGGLTGTDASSVYFNKNDTSNNYIQLTSAGVQLVADALDISNDLNVGGDAFISGDLLVEGDVTIKDSGASLRKIPQVIGVVANNGYVQYPECLDDSNKRLIPFQTANLPTSTNNAPLLGFYPNIIEDDVNSRWQVQLKNITEDGTDINAASNSRIGVVSYCDE